MNFKRSRDLLSMAKRCDAMLTGRPSLFFGDGIPFSGAPLFVERASGPYLWDIDGNKLLDCVLGWGSVILGHAERGVDDAVIDIIRRGINPTLVNPIQLDLAELLSLEVPGADKSAFFKTGSDATSVAIRMSRAITGRKSIAFCGLHGWHDWSSIGVPGVLGEAVKHTHPLPFNNLQSCMQTIEHLDDGLACVIAMPFGDELPEPRFLSSLRDAAHSVGALFVLDEIRTAFRIHPQGAQGKYELEADLVTVGKALANGYPISALCGRAELMDYVASLGITVTYYRSPAAMAAAIATVTQLVETGGQDRLFDLGCRLQRNVEELCSSFRNTFSFHGHPSMPCPHFEGLGERDQKKSRELLCYGLLRQGVLTPATHHWFLATSMSEHDIDFLSEATARSVRHVAEKTDGFSRPL